MANAVSGIDDFDEKATLRRLILLMMSAYFLQQALMINRLYVSELLHSVAVTDKRNH